MKNRNVGKTILFFFLIKENASPEWPSEAPGGAWVLCVLRYNLRLRNVLRASRTRLDLAGKT